MKLFLSRFALALALVAGAAVAQTNHFNVLDVPPGVPFGTSLPATCVSGQIYFKTDATAGQNLYGCSSTNTWTAQGGSGTPAFSAITSGSNTTATMTVGSGGTITYSGTGIVNANQIGGTAAPEYAIPSNAGDNVYVLSTSGGTGGVPQLSNRTLTPLANGGTNCAAPWVTNAQTATYQVLAADFTCFKTISVASGTFTVTLVASGSQPVAGTSIRVLNYGSGVVTIARSGQNINGGTSSITLPAASATNPSAAIIQSDGSNYFATTMVGSAVTTLASLTSINGSTVPTAAGSAAFGMSIRSGTATINPGLLTSGSCSSAIDGGTATGVLTTDSIEYAFNADPSATTGYSGIGTAVTIYKYPTADHVNFKVCNWTGASITPTSVTLNWRVAR